MHTQFYYKKKFVICSKCFMYGTCKLRVCQLYYEYFVLCSTTLALLSSTFGIYFYSILY